MFLFVFIRENASQASALDEKQKSPVPGRNKAVLCSAHRKGNTMTVRKAGGFRLSDVKRECAYLKRRRDEETKRRRDEETKRRRDEETKLYHDLPERQIYFHNENLRVHAYTSNRNSPHIIPAVAGIAAHVLQFFGLSDCYHDPSGRDQDDEQWHGYHAFNWIKAL